jgi:hypothetical protein
MLLRYWPHFDEKIFTWMENIDEKYHFLTYMDENYLWKTG